MVGSPGALYTFSVEMPTGAGVRQMIPSDSTVHVIVAPEQKYRVIAQDTLDEVVIEHEGRGAAMICRLGELPGARDYSGWLRPPKE